MLGRSVAGSLAGRDLATGGLVRRRLERRFPETEETLSADVAQVQQHPANQCSQAYPATAPSIPAAAASPSEEFGKAGSTRRAERSRNQRCRKTYADRQRRTGLQRRALGCPMSRHDVDQRRGEAGGGKDRKSTLGRLTLPVRFFRPKLLTRTL